MQQLLREIGRFLIYLLILKANYLLFLNKSSKHKINLPKYPIAAFKSAETQAEDVFRPQTGNKWHLSLRNIAFDGLSGTHQKL